MNYLCLDLYGYTFLGPLVGVMLLVFIGNGAGAMNAFKGTLGYKHNTGWIFTSLAWGIGSALGILFSIVIKSVGYKIAFVKTGIHIHIAFGIINPAFSMTLFMSGIWPTQIGWLPAFCLFIVTILGQFCGGILGQIILDCIYWPYFRGSDLVTIKRMHCEHSPLHGDWTTNMFTEFTGTGILAGIGIIAAGFETGYIRSVLWLPFVIGLTVTAMRSAVGSDIALNPARDIPPRIVFYFLPLEKLGFSRQEQKALFAPSYSFWVETCSPLLGGIFVSGWAWLVPTISDAYFNSSFVHNPLLFFNLHSVLKK